jgi:hypothetical protein
MSLRRYSAIVLATLVLSLGALRAALSEATWVAAAIGALLAALNTVAAFALVRWSASHSNLAFFQAILGGMVVRMAVLLGATVAAILGGLPRVPFATALLAYFAGFLALELTVTHRGTVSSRPEAGR